MIGLEYILALYNMPHTELAEELGIARQNINQWIKGKGKGKIPKKYLPILSKKFGISEKYFNKELNEVDEIKIQKLKIAKEIKENPVIVGYDPQLTFFSEEPMHKDESENIVFGETPIYLGQSELKELDEELEHITKGKVKEAFLKIEDEEDKKDIILELIELLEDDDFKREIILQGLKYFDDEDTLQELKEEVNNIGIND